MEFTFYDGVVVPVKGVVRTLSHILHKAEQQPNADALLKARLREDMLPLPDQVRIVTQFAENLAARLTGREAVAFENDLTSFAKFHERTETVLKTLEGLDKDVVNQRANVAEPTAMGPFKEVPMSAAHFAHTISLPNIYFHVTTAYGILRKEGVPLGKMDYFTGFFPTQIEGKQ